MDPIASIVGNDNGTQASVGWRGDGGVMEGWIGGMEGGNGWWIVYQGRAQRVLQQEADQKKVYRNHMTSGRSTLSCGAAIATVNGSHTGEANMWLSNMWFVLSCRGSA
ncbi:unnamed protein product [Boreogadus saida]